MSLRSRIKARLARNKVERGTLVVSTRSLHGKLYNFWRDHAEFKNPKNGYRENLCHYVRVVLFWAPIAVFLHSKPRVLFGVRPAVIAGIALGVVGMAFALLLNPGGTLLTILLILGSAVVAFGLFFLAYTIDDHKNEIRTWWRTNGRGASSIKTVGRVLSFPFRLLGHGLGWLLEYVYDPIADFCGKPVKVLGDFPLGGVLASVAVVIAIALGSIFYSILVLVIAIGVVAGLALLFGLLIFADWLRDVWPTRSVGAPRKVKDENILRVGARFAAAKKGKICPFIEVQ